MSIYITTHEKIIYNNIGNYAFDARRNSGARGAAYRQFGAI